MRSEEEVAGKVDKDTRKFVTFKLDDEEFGADVLQMKEVSEMEEITRVPTAPPYVEGVVNLRGTITPIIDLRERLDLSSRDPDAEAKILIGEHEDHFIGMIVDEVTDVLEILEENIDSTPELVTTEVSQKYLSGVAKVGEDRLIVILDVDKVLSREELEEVKEVKEEAEKS